jgi:hypothetical protein
MATRILLRIREASEFPRLSEASLLDCHCEPERRGNLPLRLLELNGVQRLLEPFPGREARQDVRDARGVHIPFRGLTSRRDPDPERTEIAQLHDVAACDLARDDAQEIFDHRRRIGRADGGHIGGHLRHIALIHLAGCHHRRIELLGSHLVSRLAARYYIEFDGHTSSYVKN